MFLGYALRKLLVYLSAVAMILFAIAHLTLLKLLSVVFPGLMKKIHLKMGEKFTMTQNPKFKYEDWGPSFFSLAFIKTVLSVNWCSLGLEAFEGHAAPDTALFTLDGQKTSIHRFLKGNRPLLDEFKQLVKDFSDVADFLVVYLAEAHATDAWAFANNVDIKVHKTLEERLAAARTLVKEDPLCPVVVDEMTNITASKYGALPERLYVIQSGKVFYQGGIGPWGYNPEEVRKVLEKIK
uniref:Iodothyronine deiodinase n=1 Tax=Cyprinus carpio carpio TaxID=630221 RepID=A0A8C1ER37_CYPCA